MADRQVLVAELADLIASGELAPGAPLPTQRAFARQRGISVSTASRVYAELTRVGLVVGEVGRGTFVRSHARTAEPAVEPASSPADLEYNFPILPEQSELMAAGLQRVAAVKSLRASLSPSTVAGTPEARQSVARALLRDRDVPPQAILFAGSGRQAIAATLAAVVPSGGRLGVEQFTYPVVRGIAGRLGIKLVPLDVDDCGVDAAAIRVAHKAQPLDALYLQPALHNPLGVTLSQERRAQLLRTAADFDLPIVEDGIYSFLHDHRLVAADAPTRTILIDSLSKRLAPGLNVGFVFAPSGFADRIAFSARSGGWTASRFAIDAATQWLNDGTAATVQNLKRADARRRQRVARDHLGGFEIQSSPESYHLWWRLPHDWRADLFVAAAARAGIAITPAAAFAVDDEAVPDAVRLALASPSLEALEDALETLAAIARMSPLGHPHE